MPIQNEISAPLPPGVEEAAMQPSDAAAERPLTQLTRDSALRTARYAIDFGLETLEEPYASELATAYLQLHAENARLRQGASSGLPVCPNCDATTEYCGHCGAGLEDA